MTSNLSQILVLGGTGKTGRRVAEALRRSGVTPRVASRRSATRFDWTDRATWEPALTGMEAVYIVDSMGPEAPAEIADFSALAARTGVRRLVYLSGRPYGEIGGAWWMRIEEAVKASGLEWTILRPSWFAQNFTEELGMFGSLWETGELALPTGNGREAFIDLEDLAEVAAVVLTRQGHAGRIYVLSGPRSLSFGDAVAELAEASGRPLRFVPISLDAHRAEFTAAGYPDHMVDDLHDLYEHISEERGAEPVDGVREVLGRAPRDFSDYVSRTDFTRL